MSVRKIITSLLLGAALPMSPAGAEDGVEVHLDEKSPAMHMIIGKQSVFAVPAFEDYMYMFFDLCDAMELKVGEECQIYPMNAEIGLNAIATEQEGNLLIIYDRRLSMEVGSDGAMMIIGHELGHHYCRHLGKTGDPNLELEADRFAAAAMKKAGMSLDSALSVLPILDERASKSHPSRDARIAAIKAGWNNPETGKDCRK
jgi:Zn-dependent protease with chaperone function